MRGFFATFSSKRLFSTIHNLPNYCKIFTPSSRSSIPTVRPQPSSRRQLRTVITQPHPRHHPHPPPTHPPQVNISVSGVTDNTIFSSASVPPNVTSPSEGGGGLTGIIQSAINQVFRGSNWSATSQPQSGQLIDN